MNSEAKCYTAEIPDLDISQSFDSVNNPLNSPREIGCFSVDATRKIKSDRSQMKYYFPRYRNSGLPIDLNAGYDNTIQRQSINLSEKMDLLLQWISEQGLEAIDEKCSDPVEFITQRGTLRTILCTPYFDTSNKWIILATKWKQRIYFCSVYTDEKAKEENDASEISKRCTAYGYKFEQYMTTDKPDGSPDMSSQTYQMEEFDIVVTNKLQIHSLLYKVEVDAVLRDDRASPGSGDTSCYIEMKTIEKKARRKRYFWKKLLLWWAHAYMAGIKETICGVRNREGFVTLIQPYRTEALPFKYKNHWNPDVCFNFCNRFLNYLKDIVVEDDYRVVYKLQFDGNRVFCEKLRNPEERFQLIPEFYADKTNK